MPFSECSECHIKHGDLGCATLHRAELRNRIAPLCCECARKAQASGKVTNSTFSWTSDACAPCRTRRFAKCGGVFQKRTLSSNCTCGLTLSEHSITAPMHDQRQQRTPSKGSQGGSKRVPTSPPTKDFCDVPLPNNTEAGPGQPPVPQGAQGAWDIHSPAFPGQHHAPQQPGSGGTAIPSEWARFTDIPLPPVDMQIGLDDSPEKPPRKKDLNKQQQQQQQMGGSQASFGGAPPSPPRDDRVSQLLGS
eukprot:CAMPEP_0173422464 /NCGR_PEP_ID=MMETSP1357-20121228/3161_1 /TAXON_ID=77926 /ORGANISM="Hemiselmis rufescens, Strain PCC563" /LENGTH=247 /DNA_ID=CAMNT_0014385493 /DNA_START=92 /DNA_END=832 /DNA_ORIENTATION=+